MIANTSRGAVRGLLAFRMNVISRYSAKSIALPLSGDAVLGSYLKLTSARIQINDPMRSVATECQALIGNNRETLTTADIDLILSDAGRSVEVSNLALLEWFEQKDAAWLETVRGNIERLSSRNAMAIAQKLVMDAGQYALSFSPQTSSLRQPMSKVFLRLLNRFPQPFDNGKRNICSSKSPRQFVAESEAELMFLPLPSPAFDGMKTAMGNRAWREEWIRGGSEFWTDFEMRSAGQINGRAPSKSNYLKSLEQLLRSAKKMKHWAIELPSEPSFATSDVMETIGMVRPIKKVFTKDLSEIGRGRSVIVTA